jgi:hypothetical protein
VTIFARKSWNFPPLDHADDAGVPSLWAIHAIVIGLLVCAVMPPTVTITDLVQQKHDACHRLAEAKRKRQRQRILLPKSLT